MDIADLVMILSVIPQNEQQREQHGDQFPREKPHNSQHGCERMPFPGPHQVEKVGCAHARCLLHKLRPGRDSCLLPGLAVPAPDFINAQVSQDSGMDGKFVMLMISGCRGRLAKNSADSFMFFSSAFTPSINGIRI